MAKCRECGAEIPEGEEYCESCFGKLNTVKDSESYLDSLLNAVMTEAPERREVVFRKRKDNPSASVSPKKEAIPVAEEASVPEKEAVSRPEPAEEAAVPEGAPFEAEPAKEAAVPEENPFKAEPAEGGAAVPEEASFEAEPAEEADVPEEISFEAEPVEETAVPEETSFEAEPAEETAVPEEEAFPVPFEAEPMEESPVLEEEAVFETEPIKESAAPEEEYSSGPDSMEKIVAPEEEEAVFGRRPGQTAEEKDKVTKEELPDLKNYSIFEEIDEAEISRMFGGDVPEESGEGARGKEITDLPGEEPKPVLFPEEKKEEFVPENVPEEEEEEPGAFPIKEPGESEEEPSETVEFSDFADLFAGGGENEMDVQNNDGIEETESSEEDELDSLLSGLNEKQETEEDSGGIEPDLEKFLAGFGEEDDGLFALDAEPEEEEELLKGAAEDTAKAVSPENREKQESRSEEKEPSGKKKKEKKRKEKKEKPGRIGALYHRLFDNVKVDPSKIKPQPTKEEIEAKKKAAQEAKERSKEEKEALLAEKKEQERQEKAEKQRKAKEAKAEKKEKKLKEAKLLLQEMENTRINRAGAAIVFIFFAMIAVLIIFGTDIFSYSLSIQNATREFERDEYTLAYDEIYGLDVKEEDIVLYDRIMTVMYVQKHLNSYYNYYEMKDYPQALHSLLKGLQRYEKYIDLAVELEIDSDLDSVRSAILTEISASFSMSEQEAMSIIQSASQLEYSIRVYDAAEKAK